MSKEEFIAVVKAASEMISNALMACDEIKEKYVDVCCISNRIQLNTSYYDDVTISGKRGYDPFDEQRWVIKEEENDEEDA